MEEMTRLSKNMLMPWATLDRFKSPFDQNSRILCPQRGRSLETTCNILYKIVGFRLLVETKQKNPRCLSETKSRCHQVTLSNISSSFVHCIFPLKSIENADCFIFQCFGSAESLCPSAKASCWSGDESYRPR